MKEFEAENARVKRMYGVGDRAAFEMEDVTVSGYTMREGGNRTPEFPPSYATPTEEEDVLRPAFYPDDGA